MHIRTQIRQTVASLITNALPDVTVKNTLGFKFDDSELPAIDVVTSSESVEEAVIGRVLQVVLELQVKLITRGDVSASDADSICETIQETILSNGQLNGLAKCTDYDGFDQDSVTEGDGLHCVQTLRFEIEYNVSKTDFSQPY
jgi:hypothetical protein